MRCPALGEFSARTAYEWNGFVEASTADDGTILHQRVFLVKELTHLPRPENRKAYK